MLKSILKLVLGLKVLSDLYHNMQIRNSSLTFTAFDNETEQSIQNYLLKTAIIALCW